LHPRRLCRARAPLAPMPLSGQRLNVAAIGDPGASGYSADLPPRQWASVPAGSKGLKKILRYPSALLFALLGMSHDIPVVHRTQLRCGEADSAEISGLQPGIRVATSLPAPHPVSMGATRCGRRISPSRRTFENYTVVASALVAELWQTRPDQTRVPSTGVQVQFLPSALRGVERPWRNWKTCRIQAPVPMPGRAGSTPAGRTQHRGSLVKSRITLGFYPFVPGSSPGRPTDTTCAVS
jgi:hypothetical protein